MIRIGIDPIIVQLGPVAISWHGFFTFVGVTVAIFLVSRWAKRQSIDPDIIYSTAIWAIISGIVGARLVHVVDFWEFYSANLLQIFVITVGGVGLWGAILGGLVGGLIYTWAKGYPARRIMDLTAPAMVISQAIGRIGDIINGEHCSRTTSMPWGTSYSHPDSPARECFGMFGGSNVETPFHHPAVAYEMVYDLMIFAVLWWLVGSKLRPDGMVFVLYLALYAAGRLVIQTLFRIDSNFIMGLQEAQVIAILVLAVTVPLLIWKARWGHSGPAHDPVFSDKSSRGERRRRQRS